MNIDIDDVMYELQHDEDGNKVDMSYYVLDALPQILSMWECSYVNPEQFNTFKTHINYIFGYRVDMIVMCDVCPSACSVTVGLKQKAFTEHAYNFRKVGFLSAIIEYCTNTKSQLYKRKYHTLFALFVADFIDAFETCDIDANVNIERIISYDYDQMLSHIRISHIIEFLVILKATTTIKNKTEESKFKIHSSSDVIRMFTTLMKTYKLTMPSITPIIANILWVADAEKTLPQEYLAVISMLAAI